MIHIFSSRARDARAGTFDRLVRPHVPVLYRAAYRFTGSTADAEDLVQDVLVKVYGRVADLETIEDLRPWLLRVLYREFVDSRRRAKRRTLREDQAARSAPEAADFAPQSEEPGVAFERRRLVGDLDAVLRRLTPDQRALVTLHFIEGYTLDQLAGVFDAPVGTLKSRLHRTRAELKNLIAMEPFPDGERV